MKQVLHTALAVIAGFVCGSVINIGIVTLGPILVPPPPGVDSSTMESLAETIHLMGPLNFAVPWLAHAMGTLVSVVVSCMLISSHRLKMGYGMGLLNLTGGIVASMMIPAPTWFIVADLVFAYLPMAWVGIHLAETLRPIQADRSSPDAD